MTGGRSPPQMANPAKVPLCPRCQRTLHDAHRLPSARLWASVVNSTLSWQGLICPFHNWPLFTYHGMMLILTAPGLIKCSSRNPTHFFKSSHDRKFSARALTGTPPGGRAACVRAHICVRVRVSCTQVSTPVPYKQKRPSSSSVWRCHSWQKNIRVCEMQLHAVSPGLQVICAKCPMGCTRHSVPHVPQRLIFARVPRWLCCNPRAGRCLPSTR